MTFHIIIPAYNAGDTIGQLLYDLNGITVKAKKITVVDDGSKDATADIVRQFPAEIQLLKLTKNTGKGFALKTGILNFLKDNGADYLLSMDADLQHPVQSIPDLLSFAENTRMDLIIGARKISPKTMPVHRVLSNKITSLILSWITGIKIPDSQCGFRLMHRDFLKIIELKENGFQAESEMIITAAGLEKRIGFVPIPTVYHSGHSNIKIIGDTIRFIRLIVKTFLTKRK